MAGAGIYLGDMHAMQGDGEIAGHTCDVSGTVTLQVHVLKGLAIDGPILLPVAEDLPFLARPLLGRRARAGRPRSRAETASAEIEESLPISVDRHRARPEQRRRQRPARGRPRCSA